MPLTNCCTAFHIPHAHFSLRSILPCCTFSTHSISETERKCRDVGWGMQGEDGGEITVYLELIFCFICRLWRLWLSGLKGDRSVRMSEREVSCRVFYQTAACMHDKRDTYVDESRHSSTHSHKKAAEGATESPARPVSEVTEPDVVYWCREEQWDIQYSGPVIFSQRALEWAMTFCSNTMTKETNW